MEKYLIQAEYPKGLGHSKSQQLHQSQFSQVGIPYSNFNWTGGSISSKRESHFWTVKCTEEQLTMLSLLGFKVKGNLTESYKKSGLEKLTQDEKEALGL